MFPQLEKCLLHPNILSYINYGSFIFNNKKTWKSEREKRERERDPAKGFNQPIEANKMCIKCSGKAAVCRVKIWHWIIGSQTKQLPGGRVANYQTFWIIYNDF